MIQIKELVAKFNLEPHPEGGYFKETYRSNGTIRNEDLHSAIIGNRNYCTGIYFLLTSGNFSAFHKINQDEMWHFYLGTTLKLHMISPEGKYSFVLIGNDILNNEVPQFTVPAHHWFAAEVVSKASFAFTGCTVAPGFDFRDFVLPKRDELISLFPEHKEIITQLTHS